MKTREVVFYSEGAKMVGDIYLPDDYKEGEKRPAVLCNSGWTGVNRNYPPAVPHSRSWFPDRPVRSLVLPLPDHPPVLHTL